MKKPSLISIHKYLPWIGLCAYVLFLVLYLTSCPCIVTGMYNGRVYIDTYYMLICIFILIIAAVIIALVISIARKLIEKKLGLKKKKIKKKIQVMLTLKKIRDFFKTKSYSDDELETFLATEYDSSSFGTISVGWFHGILLFITIFIIFSPFDFTSSYFIPLIIYMLSFIPCVGIAIAYGMYKNYVIPEDEYVTLLKEKRDFIKIFSYWLNRAKNIDRWFSVAAFIEVFLVFLGPGLTIAFILSKFSSNFDPGILGIISGTFYFASFMFTLLLVGGAMKAKRVYYALVNVGNINKKDFMEKFSLQEMVPILYSDENTENKPSREDVLKNVKINLDILVKVFYCDYIEEYKKGISKYKTYFLSIDLLRKLLIGCNSIITFLKRLGSNENVKDEEPRATEELTTAKSLLNEIKNSIETYEKIQIERSNKRKFFKENSFLFTMQVITSVIVYIIASWLRLVL